MTAPINCVSSPLADNNQVWVRDQSLMNPTDQKTHDTYQKCDAFVEEADATIQIGDGTPIQTTKDKTVPVLRQESRPMEFLRYAFILPKVAIETFANTVKGTSKISKDIAVLTFGAVVTTISVGTLLFIFYPPFREQISAEASKWMFKHIVPIVTKASENVGAAMSENVGAAVKNALPTDFNL